MPCDYALIKPECNKGVKYISYQNLRNVKLKTVLKTAGAYGVWVCKDYEDHIDANMPTNKPDPALIHMGCSPPFEPMFCNGVWSCNDSTIFYKQNGKDQNINYNCINLATNSYYNKTPLWLKRQMNLAPWKNCTPYKK